METAKTKHLTCLLCALSWVCLGGISACGPIEDAADESAAHGPDDAEVFEEGDPGVPGQKAVVTSVARPSGTQLRVASYNVLRDSVFNGARKDAFARVAPAVSADVWCMQEVSYRDSEAPPSEGSKWHARMTQITGGTWHYSWDRLGRYLLSRHQIRWNKVVGRRVHASWIDTPGTDLVVVNVHLAPGGSDRIATREGQARSAANFVSSVQGGGYRTSDGRTIPSDSTIVVCGDFNANLNSRVYQIMVQTKNRLADQRPKHLGTGNIEATHGSVTFNGGRGSMGGLPIDFVLARGSRAPISGFVLNTLILPSDILERAGLRKMDVAINPNGQVNAAHGSMAVDHLPIVVDFR